MPNTLIKSNYKIIRFENSLKASNKEIQSRLVYIVYNSIQFNEAALNDSFKNYKNLIYQTSNDSYGSLFGQRPRTCCLIHRQLRGPARLLVPDAAPP